MVTTSVNTQLHVSKLAVAPVTGSGYFEISIDVYYNPATLNTSSYYNFVCGRGNNSGFHSGMMIPGSLNGSAFVGFWRNNVSGSSISKTGLTADWYRYSMTVTETTFQIKLLNLRTNVLLSGNVVGIGTVDNADNFAFTFLCYGINGMTGAYGTVGVNFSNARITRNGGTLVNVPFSSGAGSQVINVYNGTVYDLGFLTESAGWAKLSDYYHYNFRKGFTLYTKSGSSDIRIANKIDGTETTYTPPTGYTRIANYKGTSTAFNQCESKFKLDDTTVTTVLRCTSAGTDAAIGDYVYNSTNSRWINSVTGAYIYLQSGTEWYWKNSAGTLLYYGYAATTPANATSWFRSGGAIPAPGQLQSIVITTDLYNADPDRVLFTEGTGVAKEFDLGSMYSEIVDLVHDRGHLYINEDSDANFMLYKTDKGVDTPGDLKIRKYVEKE